MEIEPGKVWTRHWLPSVNGHLNNISMRKLRLSVHSCVHVGARSAVSRRVRAGLASGCVTPKVRARSLSIHVAHP